MKVVYTKKGSKREVNIASMVYVPGYSGYLKMVVDSRLYIYSIPMRLHDRFFMESRRVLTGLPFSFNDRLMRIDKAAELYRSWYPKTLTFTDWIQKHDIRLYEAVVR